MFYSPLLALLVAALLTGCAGLELKTLTPAQVADARSTQGSALDGYVLYEPVVVVEIAVKDVCLASKNDKGQCSAPTIKQCAASIPFLLPDYSRPYLLKSKSGLGKAGVDVAVSDGWRLGSLKDSSDNTAILGTLEKLFGVKELVPDGDAKTCKAPGLYRLNPSPGGDPLLPLKLY